MRNIVERAFKLAIKEVTMCHAVIVLFPCLREWARMINAFGYPPEGVWIRYSSRSQDLQALPADTLIQVDPDNPRTEEEGVQCAIARLRGSATPKIIRMYPDADNEIVKGQDIWARMPERIGPLLAKLASVWRRHPHLRLGQLLINATGKTDVFYVEDYELLAALGDEEWAS